MNKKLVWVFIFFSCSSNIFAQKSDRIDNEKWVINVAGILNKVSVIDNSFSSLPYTGINWGGIVGVKYQQQKVSHQLEYYFSKGNLKTAIGGAKSSNNSYVNFDYNNLYTFGTNNNHSLIYKAGPSLNVLYADREYAEFINNNSSFEFAASLSGAAEVDYFFNNSLAGFSISDRVNIPLISALVQPAFGSDNAVGVLHQKGMSAKDVFHHGRIVSFSSFLRIKNLFSIAKKITQRQKISINYTWDYYQISAPRQVAQANHRLGLTYSFIL